MKPAATVTALKPWCAQFCCVKASWRSDTLSRYPASAGKPVNDHRQTCAHLLFDYAVQDELAQKELQKAKQKAHSKQATVRKVLEDQLSQIQQEKHAARELKKKEAAELKDSIRQYEQEEFQKWQEQKEQQAKTKQMYSEQVSLLTGMHRHHQHVMHCSRRAKHPPPPLALASAYLSSLQLLLTSQTCNYCLALVLQQCQALFTMLYNKHGIRSHCINNCFSVLVMADLHQTSFPASS